MRAAAVNSFARVLNPMGAWIISLTAYEYLTGYLKPVFDTLYFVHNDMVPTIS